MIRLRETGLEQTGLVCFQNLLEGKEIKGSGVVLLCVVLLDD